MNTKIIVGVVGAFVIIGGAYMVMGRSSGAPAGGENNAPAQGDVPNAVQGGEFSGSIADLSTRGGEWKCSVSSQANTGAGEAVSEGTVYVSGKSVRGDFNVAVPSIGNVEAHMIADGTYVYSWSSVMPKGVKTKMTAGGSGDAAPTGQGMDANQKYSYNCQPANPEASLFTPPADVSFMTI